MSKPEPFLRWAGGKRKLLPILHAALPADLDLHKSRFFEPFVGGGALMFSLSEIIDLAPAKKKKIVINDINAELVATYRALRDQNHEVIKRLKRLSKKTSEEDYYSIRNSAPRTDVNSAVRLIYLNRTGFNGLYRVNTAGGFNVPWGKLKNPNVCNESLLEAVGGWLEHVEIRSGSYTSAVEDAASGDFVYFDPPYIPLTNTSSFSKYAKDDFRTLDQYALAGVIRGLTARGVRVMFSNSYTPETVKIFENLDMRVIEVTRSISAQSSSRGVVKEVVGINYQVKGCRNPSEIRKLLKVKG